MKDDYFFPHELVCGGGYKEGTCYPLLHRDRSFRGKDTFTEGHETYLEDQSSILRNNNPVLAMYSETLLYRSLVAGFQTDRERLLHVRDFTRDVALDLRSE